MARTSSGEVQGILGSDYDSGRSLVPFINSANLFVSRVSTCATNKGVTLSSSELQDIEAWVAAHLYCMSDRTYASRSTLGASGAFHGQTGMRFEFTPYGQTAMSLDPSGCVAALGNAKRATMSWLGKPPSEQTDYVDRD